MTKKVSGTKKLSLKKETAKDLDAGPGKAKALGEDQLDDVNGGAGFAPTQMCVRGPGPGPCQTLRSAATGQVFTVACPTLVCNPVK